jgi:hypothetical protein
MVTVSRQIFTEQFEEAPVDVLRARMGLIRASSGRHRSSSETYRRREAATSAKRGLLISFEARSTAPLMQLCRSRL